MSDHFVLSDQDLAERVVGHLGEFTGNANDPVLTFVADGYPLSLRCRAQWLGDLSFRVTSAVPVPAGARCCLLWHRHDTVLFDLASITLFGVAEPDGDGLRVRVDRKPILSNVGEQDWAEAFRVFSRNSAEYLRDYGLTEPDINWPLLETLAREAIDRYGEGS